MLADGPVAADVDFCENFVKSVRRGRLLRGLDALAGRDVIENIVYKLSSFVFREQAVAVLIVLVPDLDN